MSLNRPGLYALAFLVLATSVTAQTSGEVQVKLGIVTQDGLQVGLQGLKLLKEFTRSAPNPFTLTTGEKLVLELETVDTSSDEPIGPAYEALLTNGAQMMYGLELRNEQDIDDAATAAAKAGKIIMFNTWVHGNSFRGRFPYAFSVGLDPSRSMVKGINALVKAYANQNSDEGAKRPTIAVMVGECAQKGACGELQAKCEGIARSASSYDFMGLFHFGDTDLPAQVYEISKINPSILIACVDSAQAVNLVFTSRALGLSPGAIFMTEGSSDAVREAIGAPNSNYIMSPVDWVTSIGTPCRIFGSGKKFGDAFMDRFNSTPTPADASAAAGGIALLAAVEKAGSWPLSANQVREGLLGLWSVDSLYHPLDFTENGTLKGGSAVVQQVLPLPESFPQAMRFKQSFVQEIDDATRLPAFPMPSWQDKEVQVFPCDAGYIVDPTKENLTCVGCKTGTQRPPFELECRPCTAGMYNMRTGQARCTACPPGADCRGEGIDLPQSLEGYFLMPGTKHDDSFYKICHTGVCAGGNKCVEGNKGVLCMECKAGYSNAGFSVYGRSAVCHPCGNATYGIATFIAVAALIALIFYLTAWLSLESAKSVKSVHSVLVKIFWNYLHTCCIVAAVTLFGHIPIVSLFVDLALTPLSAINGSDCTLNSSDMPKYQAQVIIGLTMIPGAIIVIYILHQFSLILELKRLSSRRPYYDESNAEGEGADEGVLANADKRSVGSEEMTGQELRERALKNTLAARSRWAWIVTWFLWPATVYKLLQVLTCDELDIVRLKSEPSVECFVGDHALWATIGGLGLAAYGVGFPVVMCWKLYRIKDRLMDDEVREPYGFLFNGLQPQYYNFEVLYTSRKFIFLLLGAVPSHVMQSICMFFFAGIFLGIHIRCQPFDNRDFFLLDSLETSGLFAILVSLAVNMMYEYDVYGEEPRLNSFLQSGAGSFVATAFLVMALLCHMYTWFLTAWGLLRDAVIKPLHFKQECMPNTISAMGQILLRAEPNMNSIHYREYTHCLDVRKLTRRERTFFLRALCDTMQWYLESGRHFHPGRMATAVCIVLELCIRERKARARSLAKSGGKGKRPKSLLGRAFVYAGEKASDVYEYFFPTETSETLTVGKCKMAKGTGQLVRDAVQRVSDPSAVIEEIQNALMHCEKSIMGKGDEKFFVIDKPPNVFELEQQLIDGEPAESGPDHRSAVSLFGSHGAEHSRTRPHAGQEGNDVPISISSADVGVGLDMKALRQRHEDLVQESDELRQHVQSLLQRLSHLKEPENVHLVVEKAAELPPDKNARDLGRSTQEDDLHADLQDLLGPGVKLAPQREEVHQESVEEEIEAHMEQAKPLTFWRYTPVNGASMAIRANPSLDSAPADATLRPGTLFEVCEEVEGEDGVTFLKMNDGSGWVFDMKPGVGIMCRRVDAMM